MDISRLFSGLFGMKKPANVTTSNFEESELAIEPVKTWEVSQNYELSHAVTFMDSKDFRELANQFHSGENLVSKGYCNELMLKEFFSGQPSEWNGFLEHIKDKTCLEIGPCVLSPLVTWDVCSERHVIEPLVVPIEKWQRENLGFSLFEGLNNHAVGAEELISQIVGKVDGAIYCRNCIDHSPNWAFILSNISHYAAPGCRLMLWNDIDHRGVADEGHYDITTDVIAFKRLIQALGFEIVREYQDESRFELNWGCFAVKK